MKKTKETAAAAITLVAPKKTKTILIRVSPAEYDAINDAAWGTRKRLSQFVRDAAVEAAGKTKRKG
jgi:uncharacterized protein (DUF1778 family)